MWLCQVLDGEGAYWIEEPIRHDDYRHAALIAQAVRTPIQISENFTGLEPMIAALEATASDFVDARPGPDRRRHRMAAGRRSRRSPPPRTFLASLCRGERAPARGVADTALAGIRRLGFSAPSGSAPDRERDGHHLRQTRQRSPLGSGRGRQISIGLKAPGKRGSRERPSPLSRIEDFFFGRDYKKRPEPCFMIRLASL